MKLATISPLTAQKSEPAPLAPAGWRTSLLLFGVPALALVFAFYGFRPWLEGRGYSELVSYLGALIVPLALMFAAALVGFHKFEGHPLTRAAFAARMRYPRLRFRDVLSALGIYGLGMLGFFLLGQASAALIRSGLLPLPADLPVLADPNVIFNASVLDRAAGGSIRGQWDVAALFLVLYFFNILGEEFWWRGYVLPRQELAFGRLTWLVHGTMWAFFHVFKFWDIISLLPVCLLIAFSAQRQQTNWPALIAHALFNITGPLLILAAVAGWLPF